MSDGRRPLCAALIKNINNDAMVCERRTDERQTHGRARANNNAHAQRKGTGIVFLNIKSSS